MKWEYYINLSGVYDGCLREIDCKYIPGTNCYCDDAAKEVLQKRLANVPINALHFMDSGNYHYLSYFFLERIKEEFTLVLFDRHPDFQMPSFGDILSCGGWVKNAWEDLENLKKVYMVGVDEDLFHGLKDAPKEVELLRIEDISAVSKELPIYISIDKDVLSEDYASCDWDQGEVSLKELINALEDLKSVRILGVDVCGEKKEHPTAEEIKKNTGTNEVLKNTFI